MLVVHDGAEWLNSVLATIAAQNYPALDLVVVDNASMDESPQILARRIPADRLIRLPGNNGFGRAVAAALQHEAVLGADLILLLHDDLVLAPDAITRLVMALRQDDALGIVGPKLREWSDDDVLQEVGMTIDRFGRAETALEPGELDQGQHDRQREVLYVSTAGMMLRTDVLRALGGFDARYPGLRDDLDLCWRAWIAGVRVGFVPGAVGYHIAAASRFARGFGSGRPWRARELAERHTLSTLLKNYGVARLLWVLPIVLLLAVGKGLGFVATRRFGDALAVGRAWAWNVVNLPRTLRRRRIVQSLRVMSDADLGPLFAPGLPRARAYGEAVGNWLAGGSTRALLEDVDGGVEIAAPTGSALWRSMKSRPAAWAGSALLVVYLVGLVPLLGPGQLLGGDIAPWPDSGWEFLRAYASPWNGEPLASGAFASPIQVMLGAVAFLGLGSAWLAQRLAVLGLLPLAWVLALRAGRLVTPSAGPRVLGATIYTLSPVMMGALAHGRFGVLVAAALLPGILLLVARATDPRTPPTTAWRAGALLAVALTTAVAAAPSLAGLFTAGLVAALLIALGLRDRSRHPLRVLGAALGATVLLLSPWVLGMLGGGAGLPAAPDAGPMSLWRALGTTPDIVPGMGLVGGVLMAVTAGAIVAAALLLGFPRQPWAVTGLVTGAVLSGLTAWGVARADWGWMWSPALLLPAALALAGLGVIAARHLEAGLRAHAFGGRQLAMVVATALLAIGLLGSVVRLGQGPWDTLSREADVVPAFVVADTPRVGPYRVLLLTVEDGTVRWDVVRGNGPTMLNYGTVPSDDMISAIDRTVAAAVGGVDLRAGNGLGVLNVRYVVVSGEDEAADLMRALGRQPALEPLPSGAGRVFRVQTWLPRAVVLAPGRGEQLATTGDPGFTRGLEEDGLLRLRSGLYSGPVPHEHGGVLVISEASSDLWGAAAPEGVLAPRDLPPVNAFTVAPGTQVVTARVAGGATHTVVTMLQALLLLGLLSLALRPPGTTLARADRAARELPTGLVEPEELLDPTAVRRAEEADFPEPEPEEEPVVVTTHAGPPAGSSSEPPGEGLGEVLGEVADSDAEAAAAAPPEYAALAEDFDEEGRP